MILACHSPDPVVTAALSEVVPTVVDVSWEGEGDVEFGTSEAYGWRATGEGGRATLVGAPPDTDVHFRVVSEAWTSEDHVIRTGSLGAETPDFSLDTAGDPGSPWILVSWMEGPSSGSGIAILDAEGTAVWAWTADWGVIPAVRFVDGELVFVQSSQAEMPDARIVRMSLSGERTETPFPFVHHDLAVVPGVGLAAIVAEVREVDGEAVVGDRVVELLDDGTEREVWSAFDAFEVDISARSGATDYPEGADWTHANGLHYDAAEDAYFVSLYYLECVVRIDRATGATSWVLGGDASDLVLDDSFGPQHAPEWVDGELLFFDNGPFGRSGGSRLVRYALGAGVATRSWEWEHPEELFVIVLGDVDLRPGGGTLSSWGPHRRIVATDAEGAVTWQVTAEGEIFLAQVEGLPEL